MNNMEVNKDLYRDLAMRLPYGVRGYVTVPVATGQYDSYFGDMLYDDIDVLVELLGINENEIIVNLIDEKYSNLNLYDYDFTIDDFTPILRPMESIPDDVRNEMCDGMFKIEWDIFKRKTSGDDVLDVSGHTFTLDFLLSRHYDCNKLIPKGLATAVTEKNDPYKDVTEN